MIDESCTADFKRCFKFNQLIAVIARRKTSRRSSQTSQRMREPANGLHGHTTSPDKKWT